jgi:hypothetical protein
MQRMVNHAVFGNIFAEFLGKMCFIGKSETSGVSLAKALAISGKCWDRSHVVQGGDDLGRSVRRRLDPVSALVWDGSMGLMMGKSHR